MGLALAAIVKGYQLICVITDKQSKEKMDILRAVGAEVVVCPTDVEPTDPRSYYSVSKRLATETPNAWYVNQYDNPSNAVAHYEQTGPEIWEQTDGKVTHFIVGVGTGGTISGVAKYLKEQNPNVKIWGVDTYGSVFKKYHETGIFDHNEIYSYVTEGIGEDILPLNVNFSLIDGFTKVTDKDAAVYTRRLAKEEGIFVGNSCGAAIKGVLQLKNEFKPDDVVVVLFHDSGSRYVGKIFNDDWMRDKGYLVDPAPDLTSIIEKNKKPWIVARTEELLSHAIERFRKNQISLLPVIDNQGLVGALYFVDVYKAMQSNHANIDLPIKDFMKSPLKILPINTQLSDVQAILNHEKAVIVEVSNQNYQMLTPFDFVSVMG